MEYSFLVLLILTLKHLVANEKNRSLYTQLLFLKTGVVVNHLQNKSALGVSVQ